MASHKYALRNVFWLSFGGSRHHMMSHDVIAESGGGHVLHCPGSG